MKVDVSLPDCIRGYEYHSNSHYLKLTDRKGNATTLFPRDLVRFDCPDCTQSFFSETNMATRCPVCGSTGIRETWGKVELCFVPERPSQFEHSVCRRGEDTIPDDEILRDPAE